MMVAIFLRVLKVTGVVIRVEKRKKGSYDMHLQAVVLGNKRCRIESRKCVGEYVCVTEQTCTWNPRQVVQLFYLSDIDCSSSPFPLLGGFPLIAFIPSRPAEGDEYIEQQQPAVITRTNKFCDYTLYCNSNMAPNREARARIGKETISILENGWYINGQGERVDIEEQIRSAIENSR